MVATAVRRDQFEIPFANDETEALVLSLLVSIDISSL